MSDFFADIEQRMEKSIDAFKQELLKLRAGRAHPSLLDHVQVSYYGSDVPLSQVANVTVDDPRTLLVSVWDKSMVSAVEKAIMQADLGLNPMTAGAAVRVPLPPLTEERRHELVRIVRDSAESARVSVRNIRRDANQHLKSELKAKAISEDEERQGEEKIQNLTNKAVKEIDSIVKQKEEDLLSV